MHSGSLGSGDIIAGRYQVLRVLGDGGFGTVYEAQAGPHRVAVKVMHERLGRGSVPAQRFQREIELVRRLSHPGIVRCLDGGVSETGLPFIVFELLQGRTLREELEARGALEPVQAAQVARQVLEALVHAHTIGVVHRDSKPANIFLGLEDAAGRPAVKVLDFGVARSLHHGDLAAPNLTATGQMIGTPHYMSPEQVRGQVADHRADLYTCGVVLAEMLLGNKLLAASTEMDLLLIHADDGPIPIPGGLFASPFRGLIERAVAKAPQARYPDAASMLQELDAAARSAAGIGSGDWTISTHRTSLMGPASDPSSAAYRVDPYHHPSAPPPYAAAQPHPSGPNPSGPNLSGPNPSGPYASGPNLSGPYASGPNPSGPYASAPNPGAAYPAATPAMGGGVAPTVSDPAFARSARQASGKPRWPWIVAGAAVMAVLSLGTAAIVIGVSRSEAATETYDSDAELAAAHDEWMAGMDQRRAASGFTVGEHRRISTSGYMASSYLLLERSSVEIVSLSIVTYRDRASAEEAARSNAASLQGSTIVVLDRTTVAVLGGSLTQAELRGLVPQGKVSTAR